MRESQVTIEIKKIIEELPPDAREQCEELATHIRHVVGVAGHPVGSLALALVGSEASDAAV